MEGFGKTKSKTERPRRNELVVADAIHHEALEAIRSNLVLNSGELHLIHSSHNETTIGVATAREALIVLETVEHDGITYFVGIPKD
jgi:hypothetical protein